MRYLAFVLVGFLLYNAEAADFFADRCIGSLQNSCSDCQSELTPCFSITQAIACAEADGSGEADRVIVRTGIYREVFELGASGSASDPYILSGYPGESPIVDAETLALSDFQALGTVGANRSHIQIQNLIFRNGNLTSSGNFIPGLKVSNDQSDIFIRDVTITDMSGVGIEVSNRADRVTLDSLTVTNFGSNFGIFVREATNVAIRNSTISGGPNGNVDGISIQHTDGFLVEHNEVFDVCDGIDAGGESGSIQQFTEDGIIRFNHVHDLLDNPTCNPRGLSMNGGTGNNGVEDELGHRNIVTYGNVAHDLDFGSGYEVYKGLRNFEHWNNTAIGQGMWVVGGCFGDPPVAPSGGVIKNNLFIGESGTQRVFAQWNGVNPSSWLISHNLINAGASQNSEIQWDLDGNADGYNCPEVSLFDLAGFVSATGLGQSSLDTTPSFVGAGSDIYNVRVDSPVLNAGDWFARTTGSVTSSVIPVNTDVRKYFVPAGRFNNTAADQIKIEGVEGFKTISSLAVDEITLSESVTVANNAGIHYPFYGSAPPIGALGLRGIRISNVKIGSGVTIR